jgi:hypothetical protein
MAKTRFDYNYYEYFYYILYLNLGLFHLFWLQVVYSKFTDLLPKEITNDEDVQRPDEDAIRESTEKTRAALEKLTATKVSAALPVRAAEKVAPAQYIRYRIATKCS